MERLVSERGRATQMKKVKWNEMRQTVLSCMFDSRQIRAVLSFLQKSGGVPWYFMYKVGCDGTGEGGRSLGKWEGFETVQKDLTRDKYQDYWQTFGYIRGKIFFS